MTLNVNSKCTSACCNCISYSLNLFGYYIKYKWKKIGIQSKSSLSKHIVFLIIIQTVVHVSWVYMNCFKIRWALFVHYNECKTMFITNELYML